MTQPNISDYTYQYMIFIPQTGSLQLVPNIAIDPDANGFYVVPYSILDEQSDVSSIAYYDTGTGTSSEEETFFAQTGYFQSVEDKFREIYDFYDPNSPSMLFEDVANINFAEVPVGDLPPIKWTPLYLRCTLFKFNR